MRFKFQSVSGLALVGIVTVLAAAGIVAGQLYSASRFREARIISDAGLEAQAANTQAWGALATVDRDHFVVAPSSAGPDAYLALVEPLLDELEENQSKLSDDANAALGDFLPNTREVVSLIRQDRAAEAYEIQNALTPGMSQTLVALDALGDDAQTQAERAIMLSIAGSLGFYLAVIAIITAFFRRRTRIQRDLDRAIAEREVSAHSEARFRSLIQNSSSIISVVNADGEIVYQSVTVRKLGFEPTDLLHSVFLDLVHPADGYLVANAIAQARSEFRGHGTVECRLRTSGGHWMQVELVVQNLLDEPYVRGLVLTAVDIGERKMFEQQLEHQATHDPLTSLPNRVLFRDRLQHALESENASGTCHAVLFLDLDDFKTVNDSLGHLAGDEFLVVVAERLRVRTRSRDTVARFGGDEFAILIEDTTRDAAMEVAGRIMASFDEPVQLDGRAVKGAMSIGIVFAEEPGLQADDLLRDADTAMYMAKAHGKGRTERFSPAMRDAVVERLDLEEDMRNGLAAGGFTVFYQPILDVVQGRLVGLEALARWDHPRRGMLLPASFIPIAEETGLILELGALVLRKACSQVREWQDAFPMDPPMFLTVNVSAKQLMHPSLFDELSAALARSRLEPSTLILEITETVLAQNTEAVIERLKAIRALGVGLAIDDFGTGYSSLSYLHQFPVDVVKIDKSFVESITPTAEGTELPDAIVSLAHALKLKTVAEGVERPEQIEHLTSIGCDLWQGFYFAEPLTEIAIEALLANPAALDAPAIERRLAS